MDPQEEIAALKSALQRSESERLRLATRVEELEGNEQPDEGATDTTPLLVTNAAEGTQAPWLRPHAACARAMDLEETRRELASLRRSVEAISRAEAAGRSRAQARDRELDHVVQDMGNLLKIVNKMNGARTCRGAPLTASGQLHQVLDPRLAEGVDTRTTGALGLEE
eukprot:tig00020603_g11777.t1